MEENEINTRMKTLSIIFSALAVGQIIFAIVALIINPPQDVTANPEINSLMIYVAPVLVLMGFAMGNFMFKLMISPARQLATEKDKFQKYTTASIIKWAAQEAPNLLTIVIFLLTANTFYLYILMGGMGLFLLSRPGIAHYLSVTR